MILHHYRGDWEEAKEMEEVQVTDDGDA